MIGLLIAIYLGAKGRSLSALTTLAVIVGAISGVVGVHKTGQLNSLLPGMQTTASGMLTIFVQSFALAAILCAIGYLIGRGCRWAWHRIKGGKHQAPSGVTPAPVPLGQARSAHPRHW